MAIITVARPVECAIDSNDVQKSASFLPIEDTEEFKMPKKMSKISSNQVFDPKSELVFIDRQRLLIESHQMSVDTYCKLRQLPDLPIELQNVVNSHQQNIVNTTMILLGQAQPQESPEQSSQICQQSDNNAFDYSF